jgi:UDP-N-acetylmuramate--alanine ligase
MSERLKIDKNKGFPKEITVENSKVIHFVGLGGIGMSGLAKFLLELGYKVSGSDIKDSTAMFSISAHGGTVYVGHNAENVEKASLVVVSSAIKTDNPEIVEAMRKNIPIIHRSHVLEALMSGLGRKDKQTSIGVSGTHGKTTTTGMISLVFDDAKLNPSIVVGGQMPFLNTNSKLGSGKYFIAELDESDGSIELYSPDISVITNLEHDHPDHYTGGIDQLLDTFERYIKGLNNDSKIIVSADCPGIERLISRINHPGIILYSIDETNRKAKAVC